MSDVSLSALERIDGACDHFEGEWLSGRRPRVAGSLGGAAAPDRPALRAAARGGVPSQGAGSGDRQLVAQAPRTGRKTPTLPACATGPLWGTCPRLPGDDGGRPAQCQRPSPPPAPRRVSGRLAAADRPGHLARHGAAVPPPRAPARPSARPGNCGRRRARSAACSTDAGRHPRPCAPTFGQGRPRAGVFAGLMRGAAGVCGVTG
jgi:hypothetical protein